VAGFTVIQVNKLVIVTELQIASSASIMVLIRNSKECINGIVITGAGRWVETFLTGRWGRII